MSSGSKISRLSTGILALIGAFLFACASVWVWAVPASASTTAGDFTLSTSSGGTPSGSAYSYSDGVLTITAADNSSDPIVVKNSGSSATTDRIVVDPGDGKTAYVTLAGVNIDVSSVDTDIDSAAALLVSSGSLNLQLASDSTNTLTSGRYRAGLQNGENALVIGGAGTLTASSISKTAAKDGYGAGIGGGDGENGSNITIEGSVTVNATSSTNIADNSYSHGAGIGGGRNGDGTNITIQGDATVTATSSATSTSDRSDGSRGYSAAYGAGIGGGYDGDGTDIKITGNATVTATVSASSKLSSYAFGAGIGGGYRGDGTNITISENASVMAENQAACTNTGTSNQQSDARANSFGAAIGGGYEGDANNLRIKGNAKVDASNGATNSRDASEGNNANSLLTVVGAAGIGGGYDGAANGITISGGTIDVAIPEDSAADPIGGGKEATGTGTVTITGGSYAEDTVKTEGESVFIYGVELTYEGLYLEQDGDGRYLVLGGPADTDDEEPGDGSGDGTGDGSGGSSDSGSGSGSGDGSGTGSGDGTTDASGGSSGSDSGDEGTLAKTGAFVGILGIALVLSAGLGAAILMVAKRRGIEN